MISETGSCDAIQRGKASRPAGKSVKDNWTWADSIPDTFQLMSKALRLKTERIWQTTQERDAFVGWVHHDPKFGCTASSEVHLPAILADASCGLRTKSPKARPT